MLEKFDDLQGQTITTIETCRKGKRTVYNSLLPGGKTISDLPEYTDDSILFTTADEKKYMLYHQQDCCESVFIEDICGELADLLDTPILLAEESSNNGDTPEEDWSRNISQTWTFYKLATNRGNATIRWYGSSNGYYSERAEFRLISPKSL